MFLAEQALPGVGEAFRLGGEEGRHAAVVRRVRAGEEILVADGAGAGVVAETLAADKQGLELRVLAEVSAGQRPVRYIAVQGLAKGDRGELAVEMLTEVGVDEIRPWQAARSVVKWSGERGEKSRARWQSTAREAAKQSRRLSVPVVGETVSTRSLADLLRSVDRALVLHEDGVESIAEIALPDAGTVVVVVGPEGGIGAEELAVLTAAGARAVCLSDGVLRTSTAGVVAVGYLRLRAGREAKEAER